MNYNIICKVPAGIRKVIYRMWKGVYIDKDRDNATACMFVMGLISALLQLGILDWKEYNELWNYYDKWFTL